MGKYDALTKYADILFDDTKSLKPKPERKPLFPWSKKMKRYERLRDINPGRRFVIESKAGGARYVDEVYSFINDVREYAVHSEGAKYMQILAENKVDCAEDKIKDADYGSLPTEAVLSLIVWATRAERFCEGYLEPFLLDGTVKKWLLELKSRDEG